MDYLGSPGCLFQDSLNLVASDEQYFFLAPLQSSKLSVLCARRFEDGTREGEQLRQSRSNQAGRISIIPCSICVLVLSMPFIPFLLAALTRVLYHTGLSAATRFTRISLKKRVAICINREIHWVFSLLCKLFQVNIYDATFTNWILLN